MYYVIKEKDYYFVQTSSNVSPDSRKKFDFSKDFNLTKTPKLGDLYFVPANLAWYGDNIYLEEVNKGVLDQIKRNGLCVIFAVLKEDAEIIEK